MADWVLTCRVFIASPTGLERERKTFRDTLREYNEVEAMPRGVQFIPVGWEDNLDVIGRSQALINADLKKCDYFALMLWDHWGSPPDNEGTYSSGTEEEFRVAEASVDDDQCPMHDMLLLFKHVEEGGPKNADPQLRKVLRFKKRLVREKEYMYRDFANKNELVDQVRRHLAKWLRREERGLKGRGLERGGGEEPANA